ncbi:glucan synthase-like 3 [Actinidia rufa]|uniref:Glucan synthase-like 3 n=1 Tax=Actinidia rufa TaxID=165716 RepID=A0A7J0FJQ5_9ERIC|nr:glucan synthase-like 3 [Actinidia rufa]GFY98951.1 glucan synthase-like 3 [Actinidia rufa]
MMICSDLMAYQAAFPKARDPYYLGGQYPYLESPTLATVKENCNYIIAVLDFILSWKSRRSMSFHVKLRYVLKVVSAAAWVIILPITYAYTWENPPGFAQTIKSWFGSNSKAPSLFILATVIYLSPNMLAAILFLFPFIRRFLERSNYRVVMLMMWWSQVCVFRVIDKELTC